MEICLKILWMVKKFDIQRLLIILTFFHVLDPMSLDYNDDEANLDEFERQVHSLNDYYQSGYLDSPDTYSASEDLLNDPLPEPDPIDYQRHSPDTISDQLDSLDTMNDQLAAAGDPGADTSLLREIDSDSVSDSQNQSNYSPFSVRIRDHESSTTPSVEEHLD